MKTKAQDLLIALTIFDIIYLSIASYMIPTDSMPSLPNISIIFNYAIILNQAVSSLGVAPNINIFGYVIGLGWLYIIIGILISPFFVLFNYLLVIYDVFAYIYAIMTLPLNILPYGLYNIFVLLFSLPLIITLVMGIRIFYSGID
jgi:hypothetical protein